jgi:hypothetical protein
LVGLVKNFPPPSSTTGASSPDTQLGKPGAAPVVIDIRPVEQQAVPDRELTQPLRLRVKPRAHNPHSQRQALKRHAASKWRNLTW